VEEGFLERNQMAHLQCHRGQSIKFVTGVPHAEAYELFVYEREAAVESGILTSAVPVFPCWEAFAGLPSGEYTIRSRAMVDGKWGELGETHTVTLLPPPAPEDPIIIVEP
jgi:hypothetical protein